MDPLKLCRLCGEEKPLEDFPSRSSGRKTKQPYCRPCFRKYVSEWGKTRAKRVRPRPELRDIGRLKSEMLAGARRRAKERGFECTVTADDIQIPEFCPVLGIKLDHTAPGRKGALPHTPSIDRIDNAKGYVPGNVAVISHKANTLKRGLTPDEIRALFFYTESVRPLTQMEKLLANPAVREYLADPEPPAA